MSLTKVFEPLSDAIMVMNDDGELSYYNIAASQIIHGTTIETIGIDRLSSMLKLVLNEQISLPFSFKLNTENRKNSEYQATISRLYSFFIISLTRSGVTHAPSPSATTDLLSHEALQHLLQLKRGLFVLSDTSYSTSEMLRIHAQLDHIYRLLTLVLPNQVKDSAAQSFSSLLCESVHALTQQSWSQTFHLNLFEISGSSQNMTPGYNTDWINALVQDALLYLLRHMQKQCEINIEFEHSAQFITILIKVRDQQVLPLQSRKCILKKTIVASLCEADSHSTGTTLPALSVASHIVNAFNGNLQILNHAHTPALQIKLPTGEVPREESDLFFQQGKRYARELAELKLKMDQVTHL